MNHGKMDEEHEKNQGNFSKKQEFPALSNSK